MERRLGYVIGAIKVTAAKHRLVSQLCYHNRGLVNFSIA